VAVRRLHIHQNITVPTVGRRDEPILHAHDHAHDLSPERLDGGLKPGVGRDFSARAVGGGVASSASNFRAIYDEYFDFVWRSLRRPGVA